MKHKLIRLYKRLFVRKALYPFHHRLLNIGLWGVGVLNGENDQLSGEESFLRRLRQLLSEERFTVFDVGANVGDYANKIKSLYPQARVFAFEPACVSYEQLGANAARHGYEAFNIALSDLGGNKPFYNRTGNSSAHASLFREVITDIHADPEPTQEEVTVSTVDEFALQHRIDRIHLLKIDTEGNELNVLRGARQMLAVDAIEAIQFEFNSMNIISRVFMRDYALLLKGYDFYRMLPDGLVLLNPNPTFLSEIFAFQNIVALGKQSAQRRLNPM